MHKDIRIITLDLDGTLLNSNKELTPRNREALELAAERGIEIVPTTGRFYGAMPEVIRELPFVHYVISINGAQMTDLRTGEVLYKAEIPWKQAIKLMEFLDGIECIYDCFMDNQAWMTADLKERITEFAPDIHYLKMLRELRRPVPELKAFVTEKKKDIQKVQFFLKDQTLRKKLLEKMPEQFPELLITSSVVNNIECNALAANKGEALMSLCRHLGIESKMTMAFGDGSNDLSMIRNAGIGVAMANACDEVLSAADYVTLDCDHDGVADAIEKICL